MASSTRRARRGSSTSHGTRRGAPSARLRSLAGRLAGGVVRDRHGEGAEQVVVAAGAYRHGVRARGDGVRPEQLRVDAERVGVLAALAGDVAHQDPILKRDVLYLLSY